MNSTLPESFVDLVMMARRDTLAETGQEYGRRKEKEGKKTKEKKKKEKKKKEKKRLYAIELEPQPQGSFTV